VGGLGRFPFPCTGLCHPPQTSRVTHSGVGMDLGGAPAWRQGAEAGPSTTGDFHLAAFTGARGKAGWSPGVALGLGHVNDRWMFEMKPAR
jgi:hypothetical protein